MLTVYVKSLEPLEILKLSVAPLLILVSTEIWTLGYPYKLPNQI
jgi:hypothetical protein